MQISSKILPTPISKQDKDLYFVIDSFINEVKGILNGGIKFSDNLDARLITFTSGLSDVETEISHSLKKVATGYVIYGQDKAGSLYISTGGTAWSIDKIYLKSSVSNVTYKIIVF